METYERVRLLRKNLKISQEQFGERLGVSRSVIANIETNVLARPEQKEPLFRLICETFNVSYEWLTTGQGEMYIETKQSFLEKLSGEYGLSFTAQKIIECYLNLGEEQRETVDGFIQDIANSLAEESAAADTAAPATVVDNVIEVYKAADSSTGKEHIVVTEPLSEIERLKNLPRVTHKDDF